MLRDRLRRRFRQRLGDRCAFASVEIRHRHTEECPGDATARSSPGVHAGQKMEGRAPQSRSTADSTAPDARASRRAWSNENVAVERTRSRRGSHAKRTIRPPRELSEVRAVRLGRSSATPDESTPRGHRPRESRSSPRGATARRTRPVAPCFARRRECEYPERSRGLSRRATRQRRIASPTVGEFSLGHSGRGLLVRDVVRLRSTPRFRRPTAPISDDSRGACGHAHALGISGTHEPLNRRFWLMGAGVMGEVGFEPTKAEPTGLQPVPFGHSGTPPRGA